MSAMDDEEGGHIGTIVESGVDWITATCRRGSRAERFLATGDRLHALEECTGQLAEYRKSRNYDLTTVGRCVVGTRAEDCMIQLSSDFARRHWREVAQDATNVSRLDIQTTIRIDPPDAEVVFSHYRQALARNAERQRQIKLRAQLHDDAYSGMWIGAPASRMMGRIYDKGRESAEPHYVNCWRYEVQLRDEYAQMMVSELLTDRYETATVEATVEQFMSDRGVQVRYITDGGAAWAPARGRESSNTRRLRWLARQVYATVRNLEQEGLGEEAFLALGVPNEVVDAVLAYRRSRTEGADGQLVLHADQPLGQRGDALRAGELRERAAVGGVRERPVGVDPAT